ncbi:DUF563 domain-containing protein [Polynucleobacter sp. JS-Fieb-80-E5]|uniref:glycosyltransferase family 61 protein n=1 Tax=Polynucleobacter sp. JS-Fieb-80-E5 TaxID=2081050 RepID=UPI001C0C2A45|nr:glycosyltransferase 61 family protein [Polynucleobacter sp. JS-Fieb-80-E5]MBU3618788.1 glycosyltransferase family 61 protein [Polynucleobacter sp. JS-Fieb-80-E5]
MLTNYLNAYYSGCEIKERIEEIPDSGYRLDFTGALYDSNNLIIGDSIRLIDKSDHVLPIDVAFVPVRKNCKKIYGKSIYLGSFFSHYGHFLTEGLSRMWLEKFSEYDSVIFQPFIFGKKMLSVHNFIFELYKIGDEKIKIVNTPTEFESIDVPQQLWLINREPDIRMRSMYENIKKNCLVKHKDENIYGKIFLSSRSFSRVDNIESIENLLRTNGFNVIYPEDYEFSHQVYLYANASVFVSISGSGMHNVIFCNQSALIIEIGDFRSKKSPINMQIFCNSIARLKNYHFFENLDRQIKVDIFSAYLIDLVN